MVLPVGSSGLTGPFRETGTPEIRPRSPFALRDTDEGLHLGNGLD